MNRLKSFKRVFKVALFYLVLLPTNLEGMDLAVSQKYENRMRVAFGQQKKIVDTLKQTTVSFGLEMVTTGVVRFSEICGEIALRERPLDSLFDGPWPLLKKRGPQNLKARIHQSLLAENYLKRDMPLWKKVTILGISPLIAAASLLALKQGLNKFMPQDGSINNALDSVALSRLFDLFPSSDLEGNQINNGASLAILLGVMSEKTAKSRVLWGMHFVTSYHARNAVVTYLNGSE